MRELRFGLVFLLAGATAIQPSFAARTSPRSETTPTPSCGATVGDNVLVSDWTGATETDGKQRVELQPAIAINLADPRNMIISARRMDGQLPGGLTGMFNVGYYSRDGGRTWMRSRGIDVVPNSDPNVAFDASGRALFFSFGHIKRSGRAPSANVIFRSDDGGATYGNGVEVDPLDHWMAGAGPCGIL